MDDKLLQKGTPSTCPIALIIKDKQILLGFREYELGSSWTCPGGRSDDGENIEETLRREVYEEIGVEDLVIKDYLGDIKGSWGDDIVPVFLCEINHEPILMEPHKFREWQWFEKDKFPKDFINKEIEILIKETLQ